MPKVDDVDDTAAATHHQYSILQVDLQQNNQESRDAERGGHQVVAFGAAEPWSCMRHFIYWRSRNTAVHSHPQMIHTSRIVSVVASTRMEIARRVMANAVLQ